MRDAGGRFRGNGQTIIFSPNLEFEAPPLEIILKGYNEDDSYKHIIYVVLGVEFPGSVWEQFFKGLWGR